MSMENGVPEIHVYDYYKFPNKNNLEWSSLICAAVTISAVHIQLLAFLFSTHQDVHVDVYQ